MKHFELGNYFDDFTVGSIIYHSTSKTIFESDNNLFSLLTMNHHPIHTNIDYAEKEPYGKVLVVGTLVLSLVIGISVPDISGKAIANLEYESIRHLLPVFINDTIYARSKVLDCIPSKSDKMHGVIHIETIGYNQMNQDVIQIRRKVLIKKRP